MNFILKLTFLLTTFPLLSGFVLLGAREPKLVGIPSNIDGVPEVTLVWDGSFPDEISDKEKFDDGAYADSSDEEIFEGLLDFAINQWNAVPGMGLRLVITKGVGALDREDRQHSIVVANDGNISTAAFAAPYFPYEDGLDGRVIVDCDISIKKSKTSATSLMRTLTHELGHCLGLGHPHTNYRAIMGYSRDDYSANLGADDMAGVLYLYPSSGDTQPKEDVSCGVVAGNEQSGWLLLVLMLLPMLLAVDKSKILGDVRPHEGRSGPCRDGSIRRRD